MAAPRWGILNFVWARGTPVHFCTPGIAPGKANPRSSRPSEVQNQGCDLLVTLVTLDMQNCTSARRIDDFTLHLKESHQSHLQRRLDHVHSAAASSPLDNQLVFSA